MEPEKKNLCAQLPLTLHSQVRERQELSGMTLSEYMTWLITTFYQKEEEKQMTNPETRTVAFQVPAELFEQFKAYLERHQIKQKAFFLDSIQRAIADDKEQDNQDAEEQGESEAPDTPDLEPSMEDS